MIRYLGRLGFGYFDKIAEHFVVFDFQGGQSGFFFFFSLGPGNPGFSVSGDGNQFIQFRAVTVVDQPAFIENMGCVFPDRGFDEICQAAQAGQ